MSRSIKSRLEKLEKLMNAKTRALSEQSVNVTAEYLGVSDLDIEVTTSDFLSLYHNALLHSYMKEKGVTADELPQPFSPVEGIPQRWDDMTINQ
mgnify:CR=1 FL=1